MAEKRRTAGLPPSRSSPAIKAAIYIIPFTDEIRCRNIQSNDKNVLWHCEANLPTGVSLKDPEVNCEGYLSEEDEDILEGSCGLKYSLIRIGSDGRSRFQQLVLWATLFLASVLAYITWSGRRIRF